MICVNFRAIFFNVWMSIDYWCPFILNMILYRNDTAPVCLEPVLPVATLCQVLLGITCKPYCFDVQLSRTPKNISWADPGWRCSYNKENR